jgi:hypothetical protein
MEWGAENDTGEDAALDFPESPPLSPSSRIQQAARWHCTVSFQAPSAPHIPLFVSKSDQNSEFKIFKKISSTQSLPLALCKTMAKKRTNLFQFNNDFLF